MDASVSPRVRKATAGVVILVTVKAVEILVTVKAVVNHIIDTGQNLRVDEAVLVVVVRVVVVVVVVRVVVVVVVAMAAAAEGLALEVEVVEVVEALIDLTTTPILSRYLQRLKLCQLQPS